MRPSAIRKMEKEALIKEIAKLQEEYFGVYDSIMTGKEKDTKKSLKIRRNIARMLTVLKEMNLNN